MSTELLIKEIIKKPKFDPTGSDKTNSDPQISNLNLNKVYPKILNKKKKRICINKLQEKLREKEVKQKFENRIAYGIFVSLVAVLFYVST
tara:strand:- start:510 stop:779 length:270 start_codon:yes stop_codon:yes gene_type:complete